MVFRILPLKFRAKARAEGPSGKRALRKDRPPLRTSTRVGAGGQRLPPDKISRIRFQVPSTAALL